MKEELLFLIHNKQKLHINDYAHALYSRVIEALLLIDKRQTIEFIESIENEDDMLDLSSNFPRICGHFQSIELAKRIEVAIKKFENSKWYDDIILDLEEGKAAIESE